MATFCDAPRRRRTAPRDFVASRTHRVRLSASFALHGQLAGDVSVTRLKPAVVGSLAAGLVALLLTTAAAPAADLHGGYWDWWLPPDRSTHGHGIDRLFDVTFWITMVTFVAVELVLVVFLIKYRHRPEKKKAHFTHGNTRLEMAWTIAPALILAGLAVANKGVWDRLRFNPEGDNPDKATILVIGQQFKWNVVYAGPDGKLGRYMLFPKPTDMKWPGGKPFANVPGPAHLKYADAVKAINSYIDQVNPLGKDLDDPDGKDDDWSPTPGREINIPAMRPTEVQLSSKDVIHSFFLPNHRVKLDAVPGMRGKIVFTATMTSAQREKDSRRKYTVDELAAAYAANEHAEYTITITEQENTEGAELYKPQRGASYWRYKDKENKTVIRHGGTLSKESIAKLKEAGVKDVWAYEPGYWELICEELCGQGHYTMTNKVMVLESEEYRQRFQGGAKATTKPTPAATQPSNIALVTP
jgi:cytochrome c oxidase subunit 2